MQSITVHWRDTNFVGILSSMCWTSPAGAGALADSFCSAETELRGSREWSACVHGGGADEGGVGLATRARSPSPSPSPSSLIHPSRAESPSTPLALLASATRNTETWGEAVACTRRAGMSWRRRATAATRAEERQVTMVRGLELALYEWRSREGSGEASAED